MVGVGRGRWFVMAQESFLGAVSVTSTKLTLKANSLLRTRATSPGGKENSGIGVTCVNVNGHKRRVVRSFTQANVIRIITLYSMSVNTGRARGVVTGCPGTGRFESFHRVFSGTNGRFSTMTVTAPSRSRFPVDVLTLTSKGRMCIRGPLTHAFCRTRLLVRTTLGHPGLIARMKGRKRSRTGCFRFGT